MLDRARRRRRDRWWARPRRGRLLAAVVAMPVLVMMEVSAPAMSAMARRVAAAVVVVVTSAVVGDWLGVAVSGDGACQACASRGENAGNDEVHGNQEASHGVFPSLGRGGTAAILVSPRGTDRAVSPERERQGNADSCSPITGRWLIVIPVDRHDGSVCRAPGPYHPADRDLSQHRSLSIAHGALHVAV